MARGVAAHRLARGAAALAAALLLAAGAASAAHGADWERLADERTVRVVTTDEDGSRRETTVWILVLDGEAFLRTGPNTRWGRNVQRDPRIAVRAAGEEIPARVELIEEPELRSRVVEGLREKYGFSDRVVALIRFGPPLIMRLAPPGVEEERLEPAPEAAAP